MIKKRITAIVLCITMLIACNAESNTILKAGNAFASGDEIELLTQGYTAKYPGNMKFYGSGTQASMNATNWIEFTREIPRGTYKAYVYAASVSNIQISVFADANTQDGVDFVSQNITPNCTGVFESTGNYSGSTATYKYVGDLLLDTDANRICVKTGAGGITFMGIKFEKANTSIRLEGESLENVDVPSRLNCFQRSGASNSSVAGISGAVSGSWNVVINADGYYKITAKGASKDENTLKLTLDKGRCISYNRPLFVTGSYEVNDGMQEVVLNEMVYIGIGEHTIEFIKSSSGGCTLDYIDIVLVKEFENDVTIRAFEYSDVDKYSTVNYYPKLSFSGKYILYDFDVPKNGYYDIYVNASNVAGTTDGSKLLIAVDDGKVTDTVRIPSMPSWNDYADINVLTVYLQRGRHKITLDREGNDLSLVNIRFSYIDGVKKYSPKSYFSCSGDIAEIADMGIKLGDNSSLSYNLPAQTDGYYRINFEVSNYNQYDTELSVSTNSISVNKFIKADKNDGKHTETVVLRLKSGNNIVSFTAKDNSVVFCGFDAEYAGEITQAFENSVMEELRLYGAEATLRKYGSNLGIDVSEDTKYVFEKPKIFERMYGISNLTELQSSFADNVIYNIKNSQIKFFDKQDNRIFELIDGQVKAVYNIDGYSQAVDVIAAMYKDGKLISLDIDKKSENRAEFLLNANKENDLKFFVWKSVCELEPYEEKSGDIYVSPSGSDDNLGTENSPLKTIEKAVEIVEKRSQLLDGDITVHLSDGEYRIERPIQINNAVKQNDKKLTIEGGTNTVINGGKKIESQWVEYATTGSGKKIYRAETDGINELRQLWVNGVRAERGKSVEGSVVSFYPETAKTISESSGINVKISASGGIAISDNFDMELVYNSTWANQRLPISSVTLIKNEGGYNYFTIIPDSDAWARLKKCSFNRFEVTEKRLSGNSDYKNKFETVSIENSLHLVDQEGEFWYRQPQYTTTGKGMLYYIPRSGQDLNSADVEAGFSDGMLDISGYGADGLISNVTIKNISFCYGTWLETNREGTQINQGDSLRDLEQTNLNEGKKCIDSQINIEWADNVEFRNCSFSHLGSAGIGLKDGVTNANIYGNLFYDLSAGSVIIGDWKHCKDDKKLCQNITVENNNIQSVSAEYYSSPALSLYYAKDVDIMHNNIHNTPYSGISIGWGWGSVDVTENVNVIGNKVEDTVKVLNDGAPIYLLGQMRGSVIKENYFNKTSDKSIEHPGKGIYLDQGASYVTITDNAVRDCKIFIYAAVKNYDNVYGTTYSNYTTSVVREYNPETDGYTRIYPTRVSINDAKAAEIISNSGIYGN